MRADKRLGQHFLHDPEILQEIADVADVARSSGVLEIGPGEGALTAFLARSGRPVVALDMDPRAIEAVSERLGSRVEPVLGDAMTADLAGLLPPPGADGRLPVVVGNLPYNAGTAIYRRLLGLRGRVARLVLMFQREVAQRIVASAGSKAYGLLSVETALVARAWLVRDVPPGAFRPKPKVHSAIVLVDFDCPEVLPAAERAELMRFVANILRSRRKTLGNMLEPTVAAAAEAEGFDLGLRPEAFGLQDLLRLHSIAKHTTTE